MELLLLLFRRDEIRRTQTAVLVAAEIDYYSWTVAASIGSSSER